MIYLVFATFVVRSACFKIIRAASLGHKVVKWSASCVDHAHSNKSEEEESQSIHGFAENLTVKNK